DGREQPHAHIMLTLRPIEGDGFAAKKDRSWNDKELVETWRKSWAERVNSAYQAHDLTLKVDHRSHARRGIDEAPTIHLGPSAAAMERRGIKTELGNMNRMRTAANQAMQQAQQMVEQLTAKAKEVASQVMDRGARIMAEMAQIDTGKLDDALQIRQAEKILQERKQQREQEHHPTRDRGRGGPEFGR
ncbi:MAG: MobA/MobL family protein, partial [Alphaproteobacteria bacterium]|nr:MobA/MobL family protein [Alphaproteobacteria bacterium]